MRPLLALMTLLLLTSCALHKHYQDDVNFPAEARVVNTGEWVEVTRIVGDPDGDILYSLQGNVLKNGDSYSLDITWDIAESLKNKNFSVQGKCEDGKKWEKSANEIASSAGSAKDDKGLIIIELMACPS